MAMFICGGEKYEAGGPKHDTLGLVVKPEGLPPQLEVAGITLGLKTAFHVTLVAIGKIIEKYGITDPDFVEKVQADFCAFVQDSPIELLRYRDEYRFIANGERRSVVVMVDLSNLDRFIELLNTKHSLSLEYPPTHVTLYTLQPNVGIFMTTQEELQNFSKLIPSPVKL